jgi:hypothetical protein
MEMLRERVFARLQAVVALKRGRQIIEPPELAGASKLLE